MRLAFSMLLLLFAAPAIQQAPISKASYCPNFEMPVLGKDLIYAQYKNAVIRITSGDEVGTGYLIDARRGYVITATHVIQPSIDDNKLEIHATNSTNAKSTMTSSSKKKPFTLKVIGSPGNSEVALLQLVPPDAMADTNALDIALRIPRTSRESYVFGYPRGQMDLSQQTVEETNGNGEGKLIIKQAAFPGDSGSPLIDETGKVVATCLERVLTQEAHVSNEAVFIPMAAIVAQLDQIPISDRAGKIDNNLRARIISLDDLIEDLMPLPDSQHLSNVELYSWAFHLWKQPSIEIQSNDFPCPILRALNQRKLEDAEERLQKYSDAKTRAFALISLGQRADFLGNSKRAQDSYEQADKMLTKLPDSKLGDDGKLLRFAALRNLGDVVGKKGDTAKAESYYSAAKEIPHNIGEYRKWDRSTSGFLLDANDHPKIDIDKEWATERQDGVQMARGRFWPTSPVADGQGALMALPIAHWLSSFSTYLVDLSILLILVSYVVTKIALHWRSNRRKARFTADLITSWQTAVQTIHESGLAFEIPYFANPAKAFEIPYFGYTPKEQVASATHLDQTVRLEHAAAEMSQALASNDVDRKKIISLIGREMLTFAEPGGAYWRSNRRSAERLYYEVHKTFLELGLSIPLWIPVGGKSGTDSTTKDQKERHPSTTDSDQ